MKKRFPLLIISLILCSAAKAQTMRSLFADMPDSILEIMTKNNRLDCIDFIENNRTAKVRNRFDGYSTLDSLTADYLSLQLTASCRIEMKLLPYPDTLGCICMARTYAGPVQETVLSFYSCDWTPLPLESMISLPDYNDFCLKNDSANADETARLQHLQDMRFVKASLSPDAPVLTFELQPGEAASDELPAYERALRPLSYVWNSSKFVRQTAEGMNK